MPTESVPAPPTGEREHVALTTTLAWRFVPVRLTEAGYGTLSAPGMHSSASEVIGQEAL
jgi:hypothetical protein